MGAAPRHVDCYGKGKAARQQVADASWERKEAGHAPCPPLDEKDAAKDAIDLDADEPRRRNDINQLAKRLERISSGSQINGGSKTAARRDQGNA